MTTPLERLLTASRDITRHFNLGHDLVRYGIREEFYDAIAEAQNAVDALTRSKVQATVDKSWDMGWEITECDAMIALSVVLEYPSRKIWQIKAFRTRTNDGGADAPINRLKRAKEIIEVAQEVLN